MESALPSLPEPISRVMQFLGPREFMEPLLPPVAPCKMRAGHHLSKWAMAFAPNWEVRMHLACTREINPAVR